MNIFVRSEAALFSISIPISPYISQKKENEHKAKLMLKATKILL